MPVWIKDLFDFLRNLFIAASVLLASFLVEVQTLEGLGRELIFSRQFFEDRSYFLTLSYEQYLAIETQAQRELYTKGFKTGRVFSPLSAEQFREYQKVIQSYEMLRYERYQESHYSRVMLNVMFLGAFILSVLNSGWISLKLTHSDALFYKWIVRPSAFTIFTSISIFSLITLFETRRTEFFSSQVNRDQLVIFYVKNLRDNEYQSFSGDHLKEISLDRVRWYLRTVSPIDTGDRS